MLWTVTVVSSGGSEMDIKATAKKVKKRFLEGLFSAIELPGEALFTKSLDRLLAESKSEQTRRVKPQS